ncbi:hypothetical protein HMPREF0663_10249 [Hoylesella oralis ATCC 33269]|uniref:Uncharacterized protein n=1 Tax=Hoylesella oralis ATCC 33269 TaxID=873533 RepID=E7RM99_9BACT|nr:hypothetical protein HMPREF0663_10249 [Hoylesella oralis ATCC 33269]
MPPVGSRAKLKNSNKQEYLLSPICSCTDKMIQRLQKYIKICELQNKCTLFMEYPQADNNLRFILPFAGFGVTLQQK